ncbi:MAG: T9SS type A sorting domain-containing protein [Ferruginibacter sp.]|nr:T9SS type A sorting domain-containing protein [Ferruginibacter sp.]
MYKLKLLCVSLILSFYGKAQSPQCGSSLNIQQLQSGNKERFDRFMALEAHTQNYIKTIKENNSENILSNPNATIVIPVVVHILDNGNPIGTGTNLSVAQIQTQIDVLNEDFRKLNADRVNTPSAFQPVAADVNFEFRLACVDPNGNATNGITRTLTTAATYYPLAHFDPSTQLFDEYAIGIKYTAHGGKDAWPTNKYLNIWVCDLDPIRGYGQFPDLYSSKPTSDGIVVDYAYFGRIGNLASGYDKGRTASHEVGHWLNLLHIWGDVACGNDFVNDTPQQEIYNTSCPSFPHFSNCPNNGSNGDMFMNYMDYTHDACMNLFTEGQKLRMRAVFAPGGPRESFINNYFKINTFNTGNGFCIGNTINITATNLICDPVTWVVSGPASIVGGQGTNTVTLQATGNGIVTITGNAGGYTDSKTFTAGPPTDPLTIYGLPDNYGMCRNQVFNVTTDAGGYLTWDVLGGQILQGQNSNEIVVKLDNVSGGYYIGLHQSNACGMSNVLAYKQGTILDCDADHETTTKTPKVVISPNPTSGQIKIDITGSKTAAIKEIIITDKAGNTKRRLTFSQNLTTVNITIADLPTDVYILQVYDGKSWISNKIIKK